MNRLSKSKFRWRDAVDLPIPVGKEILVFQLAGNRSEKGCRVAKRDGHHLFDQSSGEPIDWRLIAWWAYIPPVPGAKEER